MAGKLRFLINSMARFLFSRTILRAVAMSATLALMCKNGGVLALSTVSRYGLLNNKASIRLFNSRSSVLLMSTPGGEDPVAIPQTKKEKKEKKEKVVVEKKEKVVAPPQGIEELREVRVQKVATMREAGNKLL